MSVVRSMLHSELDVKQTTSFHIKKKSYRSGSTIFTLF